MARHYRWVRSLTSGEVSFERGGGITSVGHRIFSAAVSVVFRADTDCCSRVSDSCSGRSSVIQFEARFYNIPNDNIASHHRGIRRPAYSVSVHHSRLLGCPAAAAAAVAAAPPPAEKMSSPPPWTERAIQRRSFCQRPLRQTRRCSHTRGRRSDRRGY